MKHNRHAAMLLNCCSCCLLILRSVISFPTTQEIPYVEYGDLKYRRLCVGVYESTLCMIIRYPFEVPLQVEDGSIQYPYPVDDRFYQLNQPALIIDGSELDRCSNELLEHPIEARIHLCLESVAYHRQNQVVVVFTRQSVNQPEAFFGTQTKLQKGRVQEFFRDHDVMVVGDSLGPLVSMAIAELFGDCGWPAQYSLDGHNLYRIYTCDQQPKSEGSSTEALQRRLGISSASQSSSIRLGNLWFRPDIYFDEVNSHHWHVVNGTKPFIDEFRSKSYLMRGTPGQATLRPLALLVSYPFAHTQNQYMIHDSLAQVMYNQQRFVEMIMNITSPEVRSDLAELGFELNHMIAFDGYPQHFPTGTSAYVSCSYSTEESFLAGNGYDGWQPSLGSSCRGPLPRNSILTSINHQERHHFEQHQFDMRWYGKTWEFVNQFWWGLAMWKNGGALDCTHPGFTGQGGPRVLKYFLQAMIDGYFESGQESNSGTV